MFNVLHAIAKCKQKAIFISHSIAKIFDRQLISYNDDSNGEIIIWHFAVMHGISSFRVFHSFVWSVARSLAREYIFRAVEWGSKGKKGVSERARERDGQSRTRSTLRQWNVLAMNYIEQQHKISLDFYFHKCPCL